LVSDSGSGFVTPEENWTGEVPVCGFGVIGWMAGPELEITGTFRSVTSGFGALAQDEDQCGAIVMGRTSHGKSEFGRGGRISTPDPLVE